MTKQVQIIREIEQMIAVGEFQPGQMLPTQKQLMDKYGVAMGTVQNALGRLQSRGVLVSTRGRGTVVSDFASLKSAGIVRPRVELLLLDHDGHEDPLLSDTADAIQRTLNDNGFDLLIRHRLPDTASELKSWAEELRAAVVVGVLPPRVHRALTSARRPAIIVGELHDAPRPTGVSQVTVNVETIIEISLIYLTSLGHSKITLVRGGNSQYLETVGSMFEKVAAEMQIPGTATQQLVPLHTDGSDVVAYFQQCIAKQRPTALLIDGGQRACRIAYAFQQAGISIPQDLSLLAISGQQLHQLTLPQLSRVETTSDRFGHRLADVLLEVLKDQTVVRETLSPKLVRGNTCVAVDS